MAFVYRAERNINHSLNKNTQNTFPGEYFNNPLLIKDIERQSSEFQSNSKLDLYLQKSDDSPGPGYYFGKTKPDKVKKLRQKKDILSMLIKNL
jgi:hypothetical protein